MMDPASKSTLAEIRSTLARMPLQDICTLALPLMGIRWRDVTRAVRNNRLQMTSFNVARMLQLHLNILAHEEADDILTKLKLRFAVIQNRIWHALSLTAPICPIFQSAMVENLPDRIAHALRKIKAIKNRNPEIDVMKRGELIYLSVQLVAGSRKSMMYAVVALGEPVVFVSNLNAATIIKGLVEGLGYSSYENPNLCGPDIDSLLRIYNEQCNENVHLLSEIPQYAPQPIVTESGIDYTTKAYDEHYVAKILGPNPPLLTEMTVHSSAPFYDNNKLNKMINMKMHLKSENIATTLAHWAAIKAIEPTSDLFKIFIETKANKFIYKGE